MIDWFIEKMSGSEPSQLKRVKARLAVVLCFAAAVLIFTPLLGVEFTRTPLLILCLIALGSNLISLLWISWGRGLQYSIYFATFVDVLLITIAVHCLGGIESTFSWVYVIVLVVVALLHGVRIGIYVALVSSLLYTSLLFAEFYGIISHVDFGRLNPIFLYTDKSYLYTKLLSNYILFFLTTIVSGTMAQKLRRSKNELQRNVAERTVELTTANKQLQEEIAERKRAEDALRESEYKFRSLVELTSDWIWETDQHGVYTYVSPKVRDILGYEPEEIVGKTALDLIPPDKAEGIVEFFTEKAKSRESFRAFENVNRHKDGREVLVESSGVPILDSEGNLLGYRGVDCDITKRKHADEELRDSEERLKILFEYAPDAYYLNDFEGRFVDGNRAAEELIGYKKEELIGKSFMDLDILRPDQVPIATKNLADNAQGITPKPVELILTRKDGRQIIAEIRTYQVKIGDQLLALGSARDVTERKMLEQQLFRAQKMESIGTLAGGIAHDFNNILGGILGYASFMKTKISKDHPFFNHIDTIERSAERAADLTSQLLAFARGGKYETKPVNMNAIVEDTLKILGRTLDKSIEIKTHLQDPLPTVEADIGQLQQLLLNLCVNASDAMPDGGQLILETSVKKMPRNSSELDGDAPEIPHVALCVTDTGIGMDKAILERIFEPFYTTKQPGKGTGLGLSMVYGVVKNHGGFANVYSEPGMGSTFKIYLPASVKLEIKGFSANEKPLEGNELILVVDDEESIRSLAKDILESNGYSVLLAEDGEQAIKIYTRQNENIHLVLLDMVMPKLGGRETFLKLRELNPKVKTLLSTGYSQSGKAQEILDTGVMGFVQKPYRVETLLSKIRDVLDAKLPA